MLKFRILQLLGLVPEALLQLKVKRDFNILIIRIQDVHSLILATNPSCSAELFLSGVAESHFCSKEGKFRWMLLFSWWKQEFIAVSPGSFLQHVWLSSLPALKLGIKTFFQVKSSVHEEFSLYGFCSCRTELHCSQGCGCVDSGGDFSWLFS